MLISVPTSESSRRQGGPALTALRRRLQLLAGALLLAYGIWIGAWALRTSMYAYELDQVQTNGLLPDTTAVVLLQRAVRWRPDLADAWRLLGQRSASENLTLAEQAARTATQVDGTDWNNWQNLAMIWLQAGDSTRSHAAMAEAVRFNRGFQAHYQMGNLAEVEGDTALARSELRQALSMATPEGVQATVQQLLRVGEPAQTVAQDAEGSPGAILARAVIALAASGHPNSAAAGFAHLQCNPLTRTFCQWAVAALLPTLVDKAAHAPATQGMALATTADAVWNQSVAQGVLPGQKASAIGQIVDGDFDSPWLNAPLSWTATGCVTLGEEPVPQSTHPGLVIRLGGEEPDACDVLWQWVTVRTGERYLLSFRALAPGGAGPTGLLGFVLGPGKRTLAQQSVTATPVWRQFTTTFQAPAQRAWVRLVFRYQRPRGTMPWASHIWIQAVRLSSVPQG